MNDRHLFIMQRVSAILLAPMVIIHLVLILYAVREGLTAAEILGRTKGSLWWAGFYGFFVGAAAVHAPIGLRNVLKEWTSLPHSVIDWAMIIFGSFLFLFGMRAVAAVTGTTP